MTTFTPSQTQLTGALDDIAYETEQLIGICFHMIRHGPGPEQATAENQEAILTANVYLEAFLLHTRVLLDFFESRTRSSRHGNELDDVLALDYGFPATPVGIDRRLRERINQDLTHLSYSRTLRQGSAKDWLPEPMARALLARCDEFAAHLQRGRGTSVPDATRVRYSDIRRLVAELLRTS